MKLPLNILSVLVVSMVAGCASSRTATQTKTTLQDVAKDWCLTIRASQVLPVYPLTEDLQPGDVFAVSTTLAKQAEIYEEKGFLALDQRVTRFHDLPYAEFYRPGYLDLGFAGTAKIFSKDPGGVVARAAFPSYSFEVDNSSGLKLAIPVQGIPAALGIMDASKAVGTVTMKDAFTYGIASEDMIDKLYEWWSQSTYIQSTLSHVVQSSEDPLFLRVVTRVYLVGGISVSVAKVDASGANAQAGEAPELKLLDLAQVDPAKAEAAASAYANVLETLSTNRVSELAGGSMSFSRASRKSVSMDQEFERPMVIGYRGFDVKVFADGSLSAPIPSFTNLRDGVGFGAQTTGYYQPRSVAAPKK